MVTLLFAWIVIVGSTVLFSQNAAKENELGNRQEKDKQEEKRFEGFRLELPPGTRVESFKPVFDFTIYTVYSGERAIASIYTGDNASFPGRPIKGYNQETKLQCYSFVSVSYWKDEQFLGREFLILVKSREGPFTQLHAWTRATESKDLVVAERVISSIQVDPP